MAAKAVRSSTAKATPARKTVASAPSAQRRARTRAAGTKKAVALDTSSRAPANVEIVERPAPRRPVLHALVAAEQAVDRNSVEVRLPFVGLLQLPAAEELAFIGGITALAVVGVLEWPVAVVLGVGHGLAGMRHRKLLRAFGEALEAA